FVDKLCLSQALDKDTIPKNFGIRVHHQIGRIYICRLHSKPNARILSRICLLLEWAHSQCHAERMRMN
uniref:Myosin motor domain-containing protein n=1 Tax=Globodera pallida TaxID=36090 RepID=A0A183CT29_GLOPA